MNGRDLVRGSCPSCGRDSLRPALATYDRLPCPRCRHPFALPSPVPFAAGDWVLSDDPALMRQAVESAGPYPSARKDRLLACAVCARGFPDCPDAQLWRAVETGIAFADGLCDARSRERVERELIQLPADRAEIPEWLGVAWLCVAEKVGGRPADCRSVRAEVVADCFREVYPNPFAPPEVRSEWMTGPIVGLASEVARSRRLDLLPTLADALERAGCEDDRIIDHCRRDGPHPPGCWVIDLLLGKG